MSLIREAIEAMGRALNDAAGVEIVYVPQPCGVNGPRGATMTAVRGKSVLTDEQTDGTIIQSLSVDFIINARDLPCVTGPNVLPGGRIVPQKGDQVVVKAAPDGLRDGGRTYELMSPPYSPCDPAGVRIRLHTVLVSQDA